MPTITQADIDALKASGQFDAEWYLATYKDVAMMGMDPAEHYLKFGESCGRQANAKGAPTEIKLSQDVLRLTEKSSDSLDFEFYTNDNLDLFLKDNPDHDLSSMSGLPLVTVVMTAYNAETTVERAVLSILHQDYPNIEVVICDDCSSDQTWAILRSLQLQSGGSVRAIRVAQNSGTYLCKNIAVEAARGEIILFQDSDDYSHPARVSCSVAPLLKEKELVATRTKYARFDPETRRIIARGGKLAKQGLITLAVRSTAFAEIGYFDAVRKAGDDEWFRRLKHLYGSGRVKDVDVSLYCAELRQGSLIADMVTVNADGTIEQVSSPDRAAYVKIFSARFADKKKTRAWYKSSFPVGPIRGIEDYPATIAALGVNLPPVIGAVCSIPSRLDALRIVVNRVLPQVDELHVYLDKYEDIPDFLAHHKVKLYRSHSYDVDMRDNAKFLAFNEVRQRLGSDFYYFTFDDDILYPFDYTRHLIAKIEKLDRKCAVGLHGVVINEAGEHYFKKRFNYHFAKDAVYRDKFVNNIGSGTLAFWSGCFPGFDPLSWKDGGMVDVVFSVTAAEQAVPLVTVQRHEDWLSEIKLKDPSETLFREFQNKEYRIFELLGKHAPWGYKKIASSIVRSGLTVNNVVRSMLPEFPDEVSVERSLHRLRRHREDKVLR